MVLALEAGIGQFNIESEEEGYELAAIARRTEGAGGPIRRRSFGNNNTANNNLR